MKPFSARFALAMIFVQVIAVHASAQKTPSAADLAFQQVKTASIPIPPSAPPANGRKTRDQAEDDRKRQSAGFLAAAEKAREFYSLYPAHEKANESKKIEVVSTLRAVQTGAIEQEARALRMAQEFRADTKLPSLDRYHVATTVTQIEVRKKNLVNQVDLMAEYEKRALDLYGEFPNEPAVMEMLLGVARNATPTQARSVAAQILRLPAPQNIKEEAQAVIDRLDQPGKPLAVEWQDDKGKFHKTADYKGKVLVFYLWSTWTPASEAAHPVVVGSLKADVVLVSVNVDTQVDKGKSAKNKSPLSGIDYYDSRGLAGPLPKQLKASKVPAVHVVDANGIYIGTDSPKNLPELLKKAGK